MMLNISVKNNSSVRASFIVKGDEFLTDVWGTGWRKISDPALTEKMREIKAKGYMSAGSDPSWKDIRDTLDPEKVSVSCDFGSSSTATASKPKEPDKVSPVALVEKWFKFFSEFNFKPQIRFINSIARMTSVEDIRAYCVGYFELTNNSYAADLTEKTKSREFTELAKSTVKTSEKKINTRLEVYYGEPGSGKTTLAIINNPDAEVVVCHSSMTPDELFRGFDFEDGKPVFKGCALRRAMAEGKTVILDEINLLTEDCRRALQAITDAKREVVINTEKIEIKDGFKVVGTMNLQVGDMTYPLPEPLVDRCETIKRFSMEATDVASLAF